MAWYWIVLLAVLVIVLLPALVLSGVLYTVLLVRTGPEKWGRDVSLPEDQEYVDMYHEGLAWGEQWKGCMRELRTVSGRIPLAAQYFDFGFRRAVIILPGRMESCRYSYYFSEPYRVAGYNVLAVDNRAHGESGGRVCSLGFREYRDVLAWGKLLHEELGMEEVFLHGVCIGASTALFALTSPDCPEYFRGMVSDGMYTTFAESFRNHMIEQHRPIFPMFHLAMAWIRVVSGANVVTDGPVRRISSLRRPILMIQSREDIYSLPEKAEELYRLCGAEVKQLAWFDRGGHSRVRCNAREKYDATIGEFLRRIHGEEPAQ